MASEPENIFAALCGTLLGTPGRKNNKHFMETSLKEKAKG